jgi:hypothetical protein
VQSLPVFGSYKLAISITVLGRHRHERTALQTLSKHKKVSQTLPALLSLLPLLNN